MVLTTVLPSQLLQVHTNLRWVPAHEANQRLECVKANRGRPDLWCRATVAKVFLVTINSNDTAPRQSRH